MEKKPEEIIKEIEKIREEFKIPPKPLEKFETVDACAVFKDEIKCPFIKEKIFLITEKVAHDTSGRVLYKVDDKWYYYFE